MSKNTKETFIEKARKLHGDKYDYSKVEFVNNLTKVCIICPEHGEFWQTPKNHLRGYGCAECSGRVRSTVDDFIKKAKEVHGDKYDYSKVEYKNNKEKVCIICPEHGEFWQTPKNHLHNHGCPKCADTTLNTEQFIEKAKAVHGDKYDYSKTEYTLTREKVCIICPEHGEFWQVAQDHLKGHGCPTCNSRARLTTKQFIDRCNEIYGNKYDYSKVEYVSNQEKVKIICPIHGEFEQVAHYHLCGHGCQKCANESRAEKQRMTTEEFIERARLAHGDKYDYSLVRMNGCDNKVKIICPIHGEFEQVAIGHIRGIGCEKCGKESARKKLSSNAEEFIEKARAIHGDKYDYSKVEYVNNKTNVCIICPKHGEFWQKPNKHLLGHGCPTCNESRQENEIYDFVCSLVGEESVLHRDRKALDGKEIDIYVTSLRIGIEFNGLYWHSESKLGENYHLDKLEACHEKGISLIQIFEDEYVEHKDIVFSKIRHILGKDEEKPKIMGRKCVISEITNELAEEFLNQYHIQGFSNSSVYLGAYYNDILIGVMTFKKDRNDSNDWELTRFASNDNYICQGIGGKMFKWFIRNYNPNKVKSFADRRWTMDESSNLYTRLGFNIGAILKPDYRYVVGKKRMHKFGFRKETLSRKFGLPMTMTEREMTEYLDIERVYDCGLIRYEWKEN